MYSFLHFLDLSMVLIIALYSLFILVHIISWFLIEEGNPRNVPHTKVSLFIPARNEEKNIGACLQSVIVQDYPPHLLEIIVCDDNSQDETELEAKQVLSGSPLKNQYVKIKTESEGGKKQAIQAGITASTGELIMITDADCVVEKTWVSTMVGMYEKTKATMLCGPVAIKEESNLCSVFQSLEMCGLSLLSGGGIKAHMPLLSNAANIAYTRKAFEAVGGFSGIDSTPSGDDILLMFKIHKQFPGSIYYVKHKDAVVHTQAQPTWKDLYQQRIRWASKGLHSKNSLNSIVSLLVFLSNFLPFICLLGLFIYPTPVKIVVSSLFIKLSIDFLLLYFAAKFFKKRNLLLYYPVAAIIVMVYTSIVGVMANFASFTWKGRNYQ